MGNVSELVREVMGDLRSDHAVYADAARDFHGEVEAMLRVEGGWSVRREVVVQDRGDGRRGKIDLVATKDGRTVAIELDCRSPRAKSLRKLEAFNAHERIVILRRPLAPSKNGRVTVLGLMVQGGDS